MIHILMVATDPASAKQVQAALPDGYRVESVEGSPGPPAALEHTMSDVILLDLPSDITTPVLDTLVRSVEFPPIIVVGHDADDETIVGHIHCGAIDFIAKPYTAARLRRSIDRAATCSAARLAALAASAAPAAGGFMGASRLARQVTLFISAYALDDAPVLLLGESGTGKELVARLIHQNSDRSSARFEPINCGAIPESLFETEIFGSERGAYTDAVSRPGLLERASGGTVFLDEIGEMSLHNQVKLLRALESGEVTRIGGRRTIRVDCRVIAATNRDLRGLIDDGTFRRDLYYRLSVLPLVIAPLRKRKQDISILAWHYLNEIDPGGKQFTHAAIQRLVSYPWPGNVRELHNVVHRSRLLSRGDRIRAADLRFG